MKTKSTILLTSLLASIQAMGAPIWVKTSFWQTPMDGNMTVKIKALDPKLTSICTEYRKTVVNSQGKTNFEADDIQSLRNSSISQVFGSFHSSFAIDADATKALAAASLDQANALVNETAARDQFPNYSVSAVSVAAQINPTSPIKVVGNPGSLIEISRSVGLDAQKIVIGGYGNETQLDILGKDVVCDLFAGNAHLEFESTASVSISKEDFEKNSALYAQIEGITKDVFAMKSSVIGRAALMGFELSSALEPLRMDHDKKEGMVGFLVESLFDSSMKPNALWKHYNGEQTLPVAPATTAPIHLKLEK